MKKKKNQIIFNDFFLKRYKLIIDINEKIQKYVKRNRLLEGVKNKTKQKQGMV